jgi:hypothetical protein
MELFDLPNVRRKEDYKDKQYKVPTKLYQVIIKCAMNNPLWQFTATKYSEYNDGFYEFEVRASNGEILGTIERTWARNDTAICIENDRIKEKRTRGTGYTTIDVDKALLQIKKTFAPMNVLERVLKAKKVAESVMDSHLERARYDARNLERDIEGGATRWVLGTGFSNYLEHINKESPSIYRQVMEAVQKRKTHTEAFEGTKGIWDGVSNGQSALIIIEGSNYIVQHKGKVSMFDEEHLPEDYKANLGMLKLVDNKVVIDGRGCRVDENTFIIKVEDKE